VADLTTTVKKDKTMIIKGDLTTITTDQITMIEMIEMTGMTVKKKSIIKKEMIEIKTETAVMEKPITNLAEEEEPEEEITEEVEDNDTSIKLN